jgi:hypothetical protein
LRSFGLILQVLAKKVKKGQNPFLSIFQKIAQNRYKWPHSKGIIVKNHKLVKKHHDGQENF